MVKIFKALIFVAALPFLSSCFIEGGGCTGPFCFGVSTEVCGNGLFCNDDRDAAARCPDADRVKANSLVTINQARGNQSNCNLQASSLAALQWSDSLFRAADNHSLDMAGNNFVSALGSDGLGLSDRLVAIGSGGQVNRFSAQSQAGGFASASEVINVWLGDTVECGKIASALASEYALACRYDRDSDYGTYWTLVLAGPQ